MCNVVFVHENVVPFKLAATLNTRLLLSLLLSFLLWPGVCLFVPMVGSYLLPY